jgi:hypothetical protein
MHATDYGDFGDLVSSISYERWPRFVNVEYQGATRYCIRVILVCTLISLDDIGIPIRIR